MLPDFLIRATIAGLGVALIAAPLGCFVVSVSYTHLTLPTKDSV